MGAQQLFCKYFEVGYTEEFLFWKPFFFFSFNFSKNFFFFFFFFFVGQNFQSVKFSFKKENSS